MMRTLPDIDVEGVGPMHAHVGHSWRLVAVPQAIENPIEAQSDAKGACVLIQAKQGG